MKLVSVIGTRPQLVKAAVVTRALRDVGSFVEVTIDTGQHYDHELSQLLLEDLPDLHRARNLDVHGGSPTKVLGRMIDAVGSALEDEAPDFVLVYGDTSSTLAGALGASWLGLPLGHVEAGLRSHNRVMREERTRVVVDHLADVLLCPTPLAVANLTSEGVTDGVYHVGDVMYDAALAARAAVEARPSDVCERLGIEPDGYSVATVHRAETTDDVDRLRSVLEYLDRRAEEAPIVLPIHPRTRQAVERAALSTGRLHVIQPLSYLDMTELVMHARAVYTDSGGLQKEAYFHRVPCVTLRSETEWVETIEAGWNRLWIESTYAPRRDLADYGDGHAGAAICKVLAQVVSR